MTRKLNQVLAIEKSLKGRAETAFTDLYKAVQKEDLLDGFSKVYQPIGEDAVGQPPQAKKVQYTSKGVFKDLTKVLAELFSTTAAKDLANCGARADVRVGGEALLTGVPSTYLLFLDKKLTDLHTFVSKFAELKSDTNWTLDPNSGYYRSEEIKTQKTNKEQVSLQMTAATDKHPATAQMITKDILVGYWTTTMFSGAIPRPEKIALLEKIQTLQNAVKEALEEANSVVAPDTDWGSRVMGHLFGAAV